MDPELEELLEAMNEALRVAGLPEIDHGPGDTITIYPPHGQHRFEGELRRN